MTATESPELTIAETAVRLDRSVRTVARLITRGTLPARRRLGRLVIDRADVERLLQGEPVQAAGK